VRKVFDFPAASPKMLPARLVGLLLFCLSFQFEAFAQPTFVSFPNDITVECDQIPPKTPPVASGNCLPIQVALSEVETIGACPQRKTIERIWTATDNCGKSIQQTHTVTLIDTKAPTITFVRNELLGKKNGDTLTLDCRYAYGLGTQDVFVEDNCDGQPDVVFKDNLIRAGNCAKDKYLLFMNCSWVATDACGNSTETSIYIRFIDVSPPEIWGIPANITVQCEGQISFDKKPYYKDFCDGQPTLTEVKNTTIGSCAGNFLITRNWIATDACGNSVSAAQVITVKDTIAPKITSKPADITIKQGDLLPIAGKVTATDNCNQELYQKLNQEWQLKGCDSVLIRSWDVRDACGNLAVATQTITMRIPKADAGTMKADTAVVCIQNDKATMAAKELTKPTLPIGYKTLYVLSHKGQNITDVANTPSFMVTKTGDYAIHRLVYDARFSPSFIKKDSTTLAQLLQKLNESCAAIDENGAKTKVKVCNIIPNDSACIKPILTSTVLKTPECDATNGAIALSTNPVAVTYLWSNGATTSEITNLKSGIYSVTITNVKDTKCSLKETIILNDKTDFDIAKPSVKNAFCNKSNGEATFADTTYQYRWNDGKVTANRADLTVGEYYVTVTKDSSTCKHIVKVNIASADSMVVSVNIIKKPTCGGNDGEAEIVVKQGSGDYTFSWGTTAKRTNLIAGNYSVTVSDKETDCTKTINFVLPNDDITANDFITATVSNADCNSSYAMVKIDVQLPASATPPPTVRVVDAQNNVYNTNQLPFGQYAILVYDANECLLGSKPLILNPPPPFSVNYSIEEALCKGNITVEVSGGTAPYRYDWADLAGNDDPKNRIGLKPATYTLSVSDAKGCSTLLYPIVTDETCEDTCINWIKQTKESLWSFDCTKGAKWCLPIPVDIFKNKITTTVNGKAFTGTVDTCRTNPTDTVIYAAIQLPVGNHKIIIAQKRGKNICRDTAEIQVVCDNCPKVYSGAAIVNADSCKGTAKICLDVDDNYLKQVEISESGTPYTEPIGTCSNGKAQLTLKPRKEPYEFIFKDTLWFCTDTLKIKVRCDTLKDTPVNSLVIEHTMCVGDTFRYCLDTLELNKGPYTVNNLCDNGYKALKYKLDKLCLTVKADTLGSESFCLYVCDPYKRCDTTYLVFNVVPKIRARDIDTLYREIKVTKSDTFCLKAKGLADIDTIFNYCAAESGKAVAFQTSSKNRCVKYEGLKVGLEKGCFVVCDKLGKCDTTIVFVKVKKDTIVDPNPTDKSKIPIAVNDKVETVLETAVTVDAILNDTLRGALRQLKVLKMPVHGEVYYSTLQNQPVFSYVPKPNTCNVVDTFTYFIENDYSNKDTALVCVTITCQKLVIFNAVSANGDGVNDTFTILGIEENPDNTVMLFNRWGNVIYQKDGYKNREGWDGTWEGRELPEGTYWYHITLPRLNKIYNGYLELRR
jgi:gliding motility-associated-like protein